MATLAWGLAALSSVQQELLLFTAFWFLVGAVDDLGVDLCWLVLWARGRTQEVVITQAQAEAPLQGQAAVFIASWQEAAVLGHTVKHALTAWRQADVTLYLGCYGNDPQTIKAAMDATGHDPRVRIVIHDVPGPTTKADCLNRIYHALCADEVRSGRPFRTIILHDSEDMVHPAELVVMDQALAHADFVQIPVRAEQQPHSPWVGGHYCDEFAEEHGKGLVVRDALGAAIPAAGVGCGFARDMMAQIAAYRAVERGVLPAGNQAGSRGAETRPVGPFAEECLTEDYELGHLVRRQGGTSRFLRLRDHHGDLVATRAFFPSTLLTSVRQKSRWIHGIAFQGWDRLGWGAMYGKGQIQGQIQRKSQAQSFADVWMALRDRRGPLTALVLAAGYALVVIQALLWLAQAWGWQGRVSVSPVLRTMLYLCVAALLWRMMWRFFFTMRAYGVMEGLAALVRLPVANLIAILAGRRALWAYVATLRGGAVTWDKTEHAAHPTVSPSASVLTLHGPTGASG